MQSTTLLARRSRAARSLLAAFFAVVFVTSALLAGVVSYLDSAVPAGMRASLQQAAPSEAAIRVTMRLDDDSASQRAAVDDTFTRLFSHTGLTWQRSVESGARPGFTHSGPPLGDSAESPTFVLGALEGVRDHAELIAGTWAGGASGAPAPRESLAVVAHAGAAAALGLQIGDSVTLGSPAHGPDSSGSSTTAALTIVGLWQPSDAADPVWFGDTLAAAGQSGAAFGPFLAAENELAQLEQNGAQLSLSARWTLTPDAATLTEEQLDRLLTTLPGAERSLREDAMLNASGVSTSGGLVQTLERLQHSLRSVTNIVPIPVVVIASIGLIALAQLCALLATARSSETRLLRARGASLTQLGTATLCESLIIAIPAGASGAAAGALAALGALSWVAEVPTGVRDPGPNGTETVTAVAGAALPMGLVIAGLATVVAAAMAVRSAAPSALRERREPAGRGARATAVAVALLVTVAAAIALWQFHTTSSTAGTGSVARNSLFVSLAPALALVACALLCLLLLAPLTAFAARFAARWPGLSPALPARQLARRISLFAVAALLVMLAAAGTSFAAAFAGSWRELDATSALLNNGSAVRVQFAHNDVSLRGAAADEVHSPGDGPSTTSAQALTMQMTVGSTPAELIALPASLLRSVVPDLGGRLANDELQRAMTGRSGSVPLPADAQSLLLSFSSAAPAAASAGSVDISVWLASSDGTLRHVPGGTLSLRSPETVVQMSVPIADAPGSTLVGVEGTLRESGGAEGVRVELVAVASSTGPDALDGATEDLTRARLPQAVTMSWNATRSRILFDVTASDPVPLVLSTAFAQALGAETGEPVRFRLSSDGRQFEGVVSATSSLLPTLQGTAGALVDFGSLQRFALASGDAVPGGNEIWLAPRADASQKVSGGTPIGPITPAVSSDIADAVRSTASPGTTITTPSALSSEAILLPAVNALWAGGVGAVVLAILAVWATVTALLSERRNEVAVLRALGVTAGQQARIRSSELAGVLTTSAVLGIVTGVVAAALTLGTLVRAAVSSAPTALPVPVSFDWGLGSIVLALFVLGLTVVTADHARRVSRLATRATREEAR